MIVLDWLYSPPYHSTADKYGRKRCGHSFGKRGRSAKLKAKNRKKRKMRKV